MSINGESSGFTKFAAPNVLIFSTILRFLFKIEISND